MEKEVLELGGRARGTTQGAHEFKGEHATSRGREGDETSRGASETGARGTYARVECRAEEEEGSVELFLSKDSEGWRLFFLRHCVFSVLLALYPELSCYHAMPKSVFFL